MTTDTVARALADALSLLETWQHIPPCTAGEDGGPCERCAVLTAGRQALAAAERTEQVESATPEEIEHARDLYADDENIEIDDDALVSRGDPDGCYIEAWLWLPTPTEEQE